MEGQKRPRVFLQKRYNTQKRFLALMLAFAMIFTSVGTDLNVAYAAEGNRVDFEIYGADLVEAINDAVETQSPVTADDLNFTNGAIEKFDALFFGEGKVYEVFPPVEGGDMDAEVRVFVRLPEDADDMYMVTGDEEVIFLYINNGEDTISCSTKIIRTVDGEEKVKSTKRITVKSYEDKFGEEESNIISKPEETLPAVPETSAPESQPEETPAETLNPAETTAPEETTIPEETEAPDATEESSETEETTEAPESTEAQETETSEETKEEVTEAETEATEAEKEETEAVEETEEPETETDEEKSQDDSAVTLSSISRHQVPVVAVKEDAELIETEAEETEKETTAAPEKETTAAEETTSKETTAAPEESTEATEETSTEAESSEEATESEEATTAPETQETEETTEAETEVPAETETTAPAETETQAPVQSATPAEPEEGNKPAATDTDLVGMGWCSTAKAYTTTLKALKVFESQIELTADVAGAENVTVTLSAMPGVVPEGSYVEAEAITDEDQLNLIKKEADKKLMKKNLAAVDIFAADVMLYDADGNEIWPDGNVKVTFEGTGIDGGSSTVYHINEGSTYAKIEAEETYYYEVNFYYNNGQEDVLISGVQYVKEGEMAIVPDAPEQEGKNFVGWEPELGPITEDTNFYAQYAENAEQIHLTVNYQYKDGSSAAQPWVAEVQAGVKCDYTVESPSIDGFEPDQKEVVFKDAYDTDQTVTVTYTGAEGRYHIEHWLLDVQGNKTGEPAETETAVGEVGNYTQAVSKEYEGFTAREISQVKIGSDGNTVVEVLYERNSYTLTWNTGEGGSYIAPSEIVYGAAVETPAKDPSRLGYDFAGWENLPATMPAQDTVVTAKWNPAQKADYKVIYWKETLTKGEYAVGEITYGKGGFVGNNIPYSTQKNYEGFKLNETKSEGNVEITPDGMAVKNVYYDRETYTIKFMRRASIFNWKEDTELRITARYGEDVSKQWEKACENDGWGPEKTGNIQYTLIANMPADNLTMYRKDPTGSEKWIYYYTEGLNGNRDVYARFKVGGNVHLTEEDKQPITGFKFNDWKKEGKGDLWLYYTRNSYKLYFENCEMDSTSIKFEAPLSKGKPQSEPGRPADVDDDYEFAGWYLDPAFENPVDWNATMPAENITIYAKWQAPEYTVSFETNGGNPIDSITVTKGEQIELPQDPEKEGDIFLGWYTDADFVKKFIPESKIVEDTTLYAKWESSETVAYTVRYVTEVNGKQKDICDPKEGTATLGTSVTEEAAAVEGYYPRSMFLTRNISKPDMVITFEYDPVQTWQYTVKYLLKDDNTSVADEETFETSNHAVAVNFKHIDGYTLVSDPVVTVTKDSAEAVFYYTTQKAIYHTQHWREGLTGEFGLYSIDTVSDEAAGKTVQAIPATYEGFTYDPDHAGTVASGTTDIQNILTMKLYYTRNQHQVKYEITGAVPDGVVLPTEGNYKYKALVNVEAPLSVPGYTFTGWTTEDVQVNNNKFMMPDKDVVLKGSFTENAEVRISYRPDAAEHGSVSLDGEAVKPVTGIPVGSTAVAKDGWAFKHWTKDGEIVSWDKTLSKAVIDINSKVNGLYEASEYVAVFGEDENGDKIPDEYQVKVTYEAVNGSVSVAEAYVTLYKDGHYATEAEGGVGYLTEEQIAEATANAGYNQASESWNPKKPEAGVTKITTATNYVITFTENAAVRISYRPDVAEHGSVSLAGEDVAPATGNPAGSTATEKEGWAFKYWMKGDEIVSWNKTLGKEVIDANSKVDGLYEASEYVAVFGEDKNSDHIPDEYQVKVTYEAVNGSVSVAEAYVTLYKDGHYATEAEEGVGYLTEKQIAEATADAGYNQASESWNPEKPEAGVTKITTATNYVITFTENVAVRISYSPDDAEHGSVSPDGEDIKPATGNPAGSTATENKGWAFKYWMKGDEIVSWNKTLGKEVIDANSKVDGLYEASEYVAVFGEDKNSDHIPDEYQVKVTYEAVNGSVSVAEAYVTLYKDGHYATEAEGGVGYLTEKQIAEATANAGYNQASESWNPEKPEAGVTKITTATNYVITFAENAAVRISYSPDDAEHGSVSPAGENVAPATGNPAGSTATAKNGWAFKHWTKDGEIVSWDRNLSKEVIDANSKDADDLYVESKYVAVFGEDKNKDNIPDDLQIVFTYVADNNGTLKGTTSEYHNKYKVKADGTLELGSDGNPIPVEGMINPEVNVTITPSTGYKFDSWTDSSNNTYNTTDALKATPYAVKDETFTAHFTKDEFAYKVYKHYENAETVVAKEGTGTFGENILSVSGIVLADAEDYNGHHYILEKVDGTGSVITANVDSNRVDIYYVLDEKGGTDPTDPTNPDGVADKYQTVFKYVSAGNGSVTGTTYEVHTFEENGKYTEASKMPISPDAAVNIIPAEGYAFDYWTIDGSQKDYTPAMTVLKEKKYHQDTTFVVNFDADDNDDDIPDKNQVIVSYEAVNGTVTITEPVYVTLYKDGHYATPEEGGAGKLEADQIADASPLDGFDPSTEQWKANDKAAEKPTTETQITENTKYVVTFGKNGYVYDVVKRYLDVNGNLVDEIVTSATALYGENILEVSGVTVLQEEVFRDEFYELVSVDGADRLITSDLEANHVEIVYQQKEYSYDVVKRFLNAAGEEVDAVTKLGTALYGDNILEVSKVTTEQEELYKDNLYELVEIKGADLLITNDIQANHVEVIYQQKEYGYDVVKRFLNAAGEEVNAVTKLGTAAYGTNILEASDVTVLQEELHDGNLYELVKVEGADLLISNDIQANHVEVIYQQKEYGYDVVKRFLNAAGEEVNAVTKLGTAAYGTNILEASDVTVLQEELHDGNLYELVKVEGADLLISNDIQANHVEIIYQQKNYNYEVVKHYEGLNETAVESTKGTAPYGTGILEMSNVDVLQHETYKEHTYVLTKVDGADKLITNDETQNRVDIYYVLDEKGGTDPTDPTNPDKPDGHPDKYQIIFRYVSADEAMGTVSVTEAEVHTFTDDAGNYVDKKEISPNGATAHALGGFAFDYWADTEGRDYTADMQNMKSQTYLEDTTFTAHFSEDKIGETDPQNPDGIPDNRQITFRYVSENPSYGTVSGTVVEVRTIMEVVEGENGYQVLETKSVNPFAEVTVSANGRYRFERWSDGTTNFANADEISAASYSADAVFTAYFNYYSGGGSGGGGGGNGGDSSRGPGVTVTIDNPDVPLAPAPETGTGDVISINDGMVPMAPLPKTGQTTMRSTLLMAFSGILLAITGFSKKRKEEEN